VTGQAVTISVSVTGNGTPTGSVQVNASTGESCTVTSLTAGAGSCPITFNSVESPMLTAVYSGDSNFSTSTSLSVPQTVTISTSTLKISPTSVNFGNVYFGAFGVQSVTLTNTGTATGTINIRNIAISQGNLNEFFAFSPFCNFPLSAGRSCTIFLTFVPAPHQSDTQSATLIITDSAAGSPQSVPMTATIINPQASLNTHLLTFGTQKVNTTSATKSVTLTNTGTTPLNLKDVDVFGDFAIAPGTTCADGTTVQPSSSCIIYITFTPQSKGPRNGKLVISDNALFNQQELDLFGIGD